MAFTPEQRQILGLPLHLTHLGPLSTQSEEQCQTPSLPLHLTHLGSGSTQSEEQRQILHLTHLGSLSTQSEKQHQTPSLPLHLTHLSSVNTQTLVAKLPEEEESSLEGVTIELIDIKAQKDTEAVPSLDVSPSTNKSQIDQEAVRVQDIAALFAQGVLKLADALARPEDRTDEEWWAYANDFARSLDRLNPSLRFTRDEYNQAFSIAVRHHKEYLRKLSNRVGRDVEALVEVAVASFRGQHIAPNVLRSELREQLPGKQPKAAAATVYEGEIVGFNAPELSAENKGRKLMEKMGWTPGSGLGREGFEGIKKPVQAIAKFSTRGLGM